MKPIKTIKDVLIQSLVSSLMFAFVMWLVLFIRCDVSYADKKFSTGQLFALIMVVYFVLIFLMGLWECAVNNSSKLIKYGKLGYLGKGKGYDRSKER